MTISTFLNSPRKLNSTDKKKSTKKRLEKILQVFKLLFRKFYGIRGFYLTLLNEIFFKIHSLFFQLLANQRQDRNIAHAHSPDAQIHTWGQYMICAVHSVLCIRTLSISNIKYITCIIWQCCVQVHTMRWYLKKLKICFLR